MLQRGAERRVVVVPAVDGHVQDVVLEVLQVVEVLGKRALDVLEALHDLAAVRPAEDRLLVLGGLDGAAQLIGGVPERLFEALGILGSR